MAWPSFKTHFCPSAFALSLALVAIAYRTPDLKFRILALTAAVLVSLVAWGTAFKRHHLIADTPTSLIGSAAQGYIELCGRSALHEGALPLGFMSGPPCVWYRYETYERTNGELKLLATGTSSDTFLLVDSSGSCIIDPERAEVIGARRKRWNCGNYIYAIEYLAPGDKLYALGQLASEAGMLTGGEKQHLVSSLLKEWKQDRQALCERFDANGDGEVDLAEWETARQAAEAEAESIVHEAAIAPDLHMLQAPKDGRPYLLSNSDPANLAQTFQRWQWLHGTAGIVFTYFLCRLASHVTRIADIF